MNRTTLETSRTPHDALGTTSQIAGATVTSKLLIVLALLAAVAPFATDLYLPAFPAMTDDLATTATGVQLTLTSFLIGIAVGQLMFGPLSDRWGRRGPLIAGALLCIAAGVAAALAPSVLLLIVARFLQGFGGAAGMVIGRAVIADLAVGRAAARAFSVMMLVGGVAPVIAPFLGSLLVHSAGWRGILWVVVGLSVLMLVGVLAVVRETHDTERRRAASAHRKAHGSAVAALRGRAYVGNTLVFGFGFAVMMAYISASPFLYQTMLGLDAVQYGLLFGVNAGGLIVISAVSARLTRTHEVRQLLSVGVGLIFAATVVLVALVVFGAPVGWLPVPIFAAVASLGLVMGNATASALAQVPGAAGTGSAVLGALQFMVGAAVSPLVGIGGETTALPLALVMLGAATITLVAFRFAKPSSATANPARPDAVPAG